MEHEDAAPSREPPRGAPTPHNITEILSDSGTVDRAPVLFSPYPPEKTPQGSVNPAITQAAYIHSDYAAAPHTGNLTQLGPFHPFSNVIPGNTLTMGTLESDLPPPLPVPMLAMSDSGIPPALKTLPVNPIRPRTSSISSGSSSGVTGSNTVGESFISQFAAFGAAHRLTMSGMRELAGRGPDHGNMKQSSVEKSLMGDFAFSPESTGESGGKMQDPRAAQVHGLTSTHPRLKVEDALGYLDQVKIIFNHKPKVYNDFLDIMKEFKSQSLDTPGVIGRVASLFKGHSDLIVGFNAFLPHGYRIEIDADEIVRVTVPGNQILTITEVLPPPSPGSMSAIQDPSKSLSPASTVSADSDDIDSRLDDDLLNARPLPPVEFPLFQFADVDAARSAVNMPALADNGRAASRSSTVPSKGVEFDYAINYVNKIKDRFKDEPAGYKRFLEILHAYQGKIRLTGDRPLDETDVCKEVDRLFGDHPDLMDDFSRFLPNACAMGASMTPPPQTSSTHATLSPSRSTSSSPQPTSARESRNRAIPKSSATKRKPSQAGTLSPQKTDPKLAGKPVKEPSEKKRSKGRPRSAEEPQDGEAPKPVRRYNKQMSKDKSAKNEALDMTKKNGRNPSGSRMIRGKTVEASAVVAPASTKAATPKGKEDAGAVDDGQGKQKSKKAKYKPALPMQRKRPKRFSSPRKAFQPTRRVSLAEAFTFATLEDFNLLNRIQRAVPLNVWHLLLKMFELYTSRAITKGKLLEIMEKLVYHKPKLVQEFAQLLQTKAVFRSRSGQIGSGAGSLDSAVTDPEARRLLLQKARETDNRTAEFDFKAFERYTESRSYRIRPESIIKRKSSGSSPLDRKVLNDKYVSCPMFSEGSQFTISKKNSPEEVMFKCEDEKYEMDMLLAGAESAMDAMTFTMNKLNSNSAVGKNPLWDEAFSHRRIITKLYGDNAPIILSHLKRSPACAIPTVLERLKQKHSQWIRVQNSMSEIWMEQARRNASKIGDYKGITFKQTDMRFLRSRHLAYEMEKLYNEQPEHPPYRPDDIGKRKPEEPINQSAASAIPSGPEDTAGQPEEKAHHQVGSGKPWRNPAMMRLIAVDEELTMEAKKREQNRERIAKRLTTGSIGNILPVEGTSYVLIYGNAPFFLFVRYHQILCDRFNQLHKSFQNLLTMETGKQDTPAYIVSRACRPRIDIPVERFWIVFMDRLLKLLDGNIDPTGFEEEMREIFRKDAYLTFTLDRLIQSITRQLHHIIAQDRAKSVRTLWEEARSGNGAGGLVSNRVERQEQEKQYEMKVSDFLKDQNCFKMTVYNSGRGCMELIVSEEPEDLQPQCRTWKDFVAYHCTNNDVDDQLRNRLLQRGPVFIVRHHRQFSRHRKQLGGEIDEEEEEEDEDLALDSSKNSKPEAPADFSLDDRSWLMTINIRSQIESGDILGRGFDKTPLTEWLVYKRGAQKIALESHRRVSQKRTAAFKRYLADIWTKKALISQEKHKAFLSVMRENLNRYKQGNSVDPPYFVYYVRRSDESERLDDMKPFWAQPDMDRASEGEKTEKDESNAVDTAQSETSEDEKEEDDTETETERKVKKIQKRASADESN